MKKNSIILVDDHRLVHHGIASALKAEKDFEVIAEVATGMSAFEAARQYSPDIMTMDISLPDMNGMAVTREILNWNPDIKIAAVTMHAQKSYVIGMLNAGAAGYILKSASFRELVTGLRTIRSGKKFLSREIIHLVVELAQNSGNQPLDRLSLLSGREMEVLKLLSDGLNSTAISEKLHISPKTVDTHRNNLKKKLNIHTVVELTKFAIARGLTNLEMY